MLALSEHLDPPLPYDTTDCHANRPFEFIMILTGNESFYAKPQLVVGQTSSKVAP